VPPPQGITLAPVWLAARTAPDTSSTLPGVQT
jgi:hypothetical protein